MRMILNKKKVLILSLLTLLIVLTYFLFLYSSDYFSTYQLYSKYGSMTETKGAKKLTIKALLDSIEERENQHCFNLIKMSEDLEEFEICIIDEKLNWENPYEDYSKLIPVEAVFTYKRVFLNISYLQEVNITLLEEREAVDFLTQMHNKGIRHLQVRIESNEEITSKGYYFQEVEREEGENFIGVTILDNFIDGINFNNGRIEVSFISIIKGQEVPVKASVEKLDFTTMNNQQEPISMFINRESVDRIKLGKRTLISFKIGEGVDVDKYMEEEFASQEGYVELNREIISLFQEGDNED
jgi:hypothetical protein